MMAHALTATRMHTRTPFLFLPLSLSPSLHTRHARFPCALLTEGTSKCKGRCRQAGNKTEQAGRSPHIQARTRNRMDAYTEVDLDRRQHRHISHRGFRGRHSGRCGARLQRPLRSRCHCPWIAPGFHCRCFPLLRAWSHAPVRIRQATLELRAVNPSLLADGPALPAKDHFFGGQSSRDRPCHQQPVARRLYGPRSAPRCAPRPLSLPRAGEDSGGMASK